MPRALLAAGSLLAGLLPFTAVALSLGDIRLESALNQPFSAQVSLRADTPDELDQVRVVMAERSTFDSIGIGRPAFLDDFTIDIERDGILGVIRIRSTTPVVEPFVSMLLDVSWPSGRLLREFTVLLDPPAFASDTAPVVSQPPVIPATEPVRTIERRGAVETAPAASSASAPASPAASPTATPPASEPSTGQGRAPQFDSAGVDNAGGAGADSYTVQSNDTLWRIAERLRTEATISHNQMMMALFRANPDAFNGNINRLLAGAELRVPGEGEIRSLSTGQAATEVKRQNDEWRDGQAGGPADGPADGLADAPARLQLVPPAETADAASTPAPVEAPPAAPSPTDSGAAGTDATETDGAADAPGAGERDRLLTIEDERLRALQDGVVPDGDAADGQIPPDMVEPDVVEPDVAEPDMVESEVADPVMADPEASVRATPETAATPPATAERGLLESLGALVFNVWFLASAAIVLLAGIFIVFSRRRMAAADETGRFVADDLRGGMAPAGREPFQRDDDFIVEESPHPAADSGPPPTPVPAPLPPGAHAPASADGETPLERTISSDAALNVDQADVVAEADFHMAYGLYDQAAALLTRALKDNPNRRDLRLKLLEVYFIWENKGAFLKEAQTFHGLFPGADDPDWNKILIMGKQICPDESLFASAPGAPGRDNLDLALGEDAASAVDVPLDADDEGTIDVPASATDVLDFDLGDAPADDDEPASADDGNDTWRGDFGDSPTMETPTLETPTIESAGFDPATSGSPTAESPTMETPTIRSQGPEFGDGGTLETPTLEMPAGGTLESPTLESAAPGMGGVPGRLDSDGPDRTEEINLEDLGLDLAGLDQAAGDLGAGVEDFIDDAADSGEPFEGAMDESLDSGLELDSTAEMQGMGFDEGTADLPALDDDWSGQDDSAGDDAGTSTFRAVDDTAEQPRPESAQHAGRDAFSGSTTEAGSTDFDPGEPDDQGPTMLAPTMIEPTASLSGVRRGPDGPTMTEVGTKLDLARAYVDMGDPDGARSILNEVLEEGDGGQRQQARQLLDDLAD